MAVPEWVSTLKQHEGVAPRIFGGRSSFINNRKLNDYIYVDRDGGFLSHSFTPGRKMSVVSSRVGLGAAQHELLFCT